MSVNWNKPVQAVACADKHPAHVLKEDRGNRLVEWQAQGGNVIAFVSPDGSVRSMLHSSVPTIWRIENVPEEPKDTVVLVRDHGDDRWKTISGKQLTRKQAESYAVCHKDLWADIQLVTVPVKS